MQFVDGLLEALPVTKRLDELQGGAHRGEGRDLQHIGIVEIEHTLVGIFGEQRVEHSACLPAIFRKYVALLDVLRALAPGQRLFVEGNVADEIKGIEVLAQFLDDWIERQPLGFEFLDDRLLALGRFPPFEEIGRASCRERV